MERNAEGTEETDLVDGNMSKCERQSKVSRSAGEMDMLQKMATNTTATGWSV